MDQARRSGRTGAGARGSRGAGLRMFFVLFLQDHDPRDSGARNDAPGSQRLCAATGEARCIDLMIRFVLGPEGAVVPDVKRRLPGRGLWVTASRSALELAIRRKSFARGFRRDIVAS